MKMETMDPHDTHTTVTRHGAPPPPNPSASNIHWSAWMVWDVHVLQETAESAAEDPQHVDSAMKVMLAVTPVCAFTPTHCASGGDSHTSAVRWICIREGACLGGDGSAVIRSGLQRLFGIR